MKKFLPTRIDSLIKNLLCILFQMVFLFTYGQEVHLHYVDGNTESISLKDVNHFTFDSDHMHIELHDGTTQSWFLTFVNHYRFSTELSTNVNELLNNTLEGMLIMPNPSNGTFRVEYELLNASEVQVQLFDQSGRMLQQLYKGIQEPGRQQITCETSLPPGSYFCQIHTGKYMSTKVLIIH